MATVTVQTLLKGAIEVDEDQLVTFVTPLLGFDGLERFVLYQTKPGPLYWLQAIEDPRAAFCILAPFEAGLDPDYEIGSADADAIAATGADDIAVYTMMVLDEDPARVRTNLRAPILLGRSSGKAKQVIFNDGRLPVQCYLASYQSARGRP